MLGRTRRTAALLYEESGGNPFYLEQLARAGATPARRPGRPSPSAGTRAGRRGDAGGARAALGGRPACPGGSVGGRRPVRARARRRGVRRDGPQAIEAIDELLAADLVRTTDVPRRFRFRHPIVRRAVYETAPAGWRIGAHERVAAGARRSWRRRAGARPSRRPLSQDRRHAPLWRSSPRPATSPPQRAPATAARWFASALRLLPDTAPVEQRVELLLADATALAATGRFAEAHAALIEASLVARVPRRRGSARGDLRAGRAHARSARAGARSACRRTGRSSRRDRTGRRDADARARGRRGVPAAVSSRPRDGPSEPSAPPRPSATQR